MGVKLRDYQKKGAEDCRVLLARHNMAYICWQVRCGKTLTALEAINYGAFRKVLFVTKKKAIGSIQKDYDALEPCYQIEITNYEALHKVDPTDMDCVIVDEAHRIGAFPKPSKAQKQLSDILEQNDCCSVIFLSGTPTPESYSQLYHQFSVSKQFNPFSEGNFYKWAKVFVNVTKRYVAHGNSVNDYSDADRDKIMAVVDKYFLRYTQEEAGIESSVVEEILHCDMLPSTTEVINRLLKDLVVEGKTNTIVADTGVKLQSKVHQLSSGTIKFDDGTRAIIDRSKAEFISLTFGKKKIAIFYKFIAERELLESVFIHNTSSPEEFAKGGHEVVFLGQMQSAREGINLSCADHIIFYNIDFSALSYWQCRDRMTSMERTKENKVYWLFSTGGIEEKIYKTVTGKKDYTLKHFENDYRTTDSKGYNQTDGGQGVLRFEAD